MSNSKLTIKEEADLKAMLAEYSEIEGFEVVSAQGITVAKIPEFRGSRMALVAFSFISPDEEKVRPKVGAYHAMCRLKSGPTVKFPVVFSAADIVSDLCGEPVYDTCKRWPKSLRATSKDSDEHRGYRLDY